MDEMFVNALQGLIASGPATAFAVYVWRLERQDRKELQKDLKDLYDAILGKDKP